ncbi:MAG TPA: Arm DNA-binding domain-containing protein, partial [Bacteroidales bacterium]|nr:Arm DNA-binding domain-containing protein [Bacteroidales bacterium]
MENKNSFSLMFFAIGSRANENGEIPLHLRITVNNRKVEMSLHRRVDKSIWNPSAGMAMGNTKNAKIINSFLMSVQTTVYEHFKYLRETGRPITAEALRNAYLGIEEEEKGPKVLELFKEHNDKLRLLEGIDYAPLTIERYETSYKHTQDYIRAKYN